MLLLNWLKSLKKKEVLFSQISNYGATVVKILSAEGKKAVLVLSEEKTNVFFT